MKYQTIFPKIFTICFLVAVIISCPLPAPGKEAGSLTVALETASLPNRSILPDIDMNPSGYTVTGSGPGGATFQVQTTNTSATASQLAFGNWTVAVEAANAAGIVIGRGQGSVAVHTGQSASLTVIVRPLDGYGALDLTVNWNAVDTENPSIDATLTPYLGAAQTLGFTINGGNQGRYHSDSIQTGYHTLIVKLLDNNVLTMGAVEVVRIVKGGTSTGVFDFTEINKPGGSINVNITPDMAEPLIVSMSGTVAELGQGQTMTVSASVANDPGNVVYVWYVNGGAVGTGQTITFGNTLPVGVYRLDVTAFTADGRRGGSANAMFHVIEGDFIPPTNVLNLRITYKDENTMIAEWNSSTDNSGPVTYDIKLQRQTAQPVDYNQSGCSITFDNLYIYTPYTVSVRARDGAGNMSNWASLTDRTMPVSRITNRSLLFTFDDQNLADSDGISDFWSTVTTSHITYASGKFGYAVSGSNYNPNLSESTRLLSNTPPPARFTWNTEENLFISFWFNPAVWQLQQAMGILFWVRTAGTNNPFSINVEMAPQSWNPSSPAGSFNVNMFVRNMENNAIVFQQVTPMTDVARANTWHHMTVYLNRSDYTASLAVDGALVGEISIGQGNWPAQTKSIYEYFIQMGIVDAIHGHSAFLRIDDLAIMPGLNTCIDLGIYHFQQNNRWLGH